MTFKLKDWIQFYKLARLRASSPENYVRFQEFQAEKVIEYLQNQGISFTDVMLLDAGSGSGGYTKNFIKRGAKVVSLDVTEKHFQKYINNRFILGNALELPFKDESFDVIFSSSIIEHIKNQEKFIKELHRTLKKEGVCYLSFPPFWSPVGAHQFKPFHYLGEKNAIKLSRKIYKVRSFHYNDKYGKLYITTIKKIRTLLIKNNFKIKKVSTRFMPINFAKIPLLNEFLTWNVEFLLEKGVRA